MKINIEPIKLLSGCHADTARTGQGCFMNVVSYLNGDEYISDQSPCVSPIIRDIAVFLNDHMDNGERQQLIPYIHRAMQTGVTDNPESVAEIRRQAQAVSRFLGNLMDKLKEEYKSELHFDNAFPTHLSFLKSHEGPLYEYYGVTMSAIRYLSGFIFTNRAGPASYMIAKELLRVQVFAFFQSLLPEEKEVSDSITNRAAKLVWLATTN